MGFRVEVSVGEQKFLFYMAENKDWTGNSRVEKALEIVPDGNKVAMYLKLTFLEGKKRQKMFKKYPPKYVYVAAGRMGCAKNGEFSDMEHEYEAGAVAFAWFIWEKGYKGEPIIRWFN
jgi:hypothetical protein